MLLLLFILVIGTVLFFKRQSINIFLKKRGASKPPSASLFFLGGILSILGAAIRYGDWNWKIQGIIDRTIDGPALNQATVVFMISGGVLALLGLTLLLDELSGQRK